MTSTAPIYTAATTAGAVASGNYPNLFSDLLGKSGTDVKAKIDAAWQQLFYGNGDTERVYYEVGPDMAYVKDIGNDDVRTEGMSYGMMIAVQLDKHKEFDRLWTWARKFMYHAQEPYQGYFAWHCKDDGTMIDTNPASDGETWFTTALFFASVRWGDGTGIYNYRAEANAILDTALHTSDRNPSSIATNMFDAKAKQVVFVPKVGNDSSFTDPSYHTPAFMRFGPRWQARTRPSGRAPPLLAGPFSGQPPTPRQDSCPTMLTLTAHHKIRQITKTSASMPGAPG